MLNTKIKCTHIYALVDTTVVKVIPYLKMLNR